MIPYPTQLPVGDLQVIVNDLRSGAVLTDKALFVKSVWELLGYALGSGIGEPATPIGPIPIQSCGPNCPCTKDEILSYLDTILNANTSGVCCTTLTIPWLSIVKWALLTLSELL